MFSMAFLGVFSSLTRPSHQKTKSVNPFLGWQRVFLLQGPWFAIPLAEIRSRWILREKADCKQSSLGLMTLIMHNIFVKRV